MNTLNITRPDDWHLHVRDGAMAALVVPESARVFARGLIMPNLKPPVANAALALAYRDRILANLPAEGAGARFQPKMTLYLTPSTTVDDINRAAQNPDILAVKWYPAGATTNSADGVSVAAWQTEAMRAVLDAIAANEWVLCIHGEVVEAQVDIFDRERVFLTEVLAPLLQAYPRLRVVLEHISSAQAVDFISEHAPRRAAPHTLAATITAHHLAYDRNAMLVGGIRPHYYCLPILKRRTDREALVRAAISGSPSFFLGTDSAPHSQSSKESACGCAGAFTAPVAMPLYAQVFAEANALNKLDAFAGQFGANFYRQPINTERLVLSQTPWQVPQTLTHAEQKLVPFLAGETLMWQVEEVG